jgi:hypothetical protein
MLVAFINASSSSGLGVSSKTQSPSMISKQSLEVVVEVKLAEEMFPVAACLICNSVEVSGFLNLIF